METINPIIPFITVCVCLAFAIAASVWVVLSNKKLSKSHTAKSISLSEDLDYTLDFDYIKTKNSLTEA